MTTLTLDVSDALARRAQSFGRWLPTVLALSLLKLRTPAGEAAAELIEFLADNPNVQEVLAHHASERAQARIARLLALDRVGVLGEAETLELDELINLEQLVTDLKASLTHGDPAR